MKRLLLIFLVLALMANAVSVAAAIDSTELSQPQAMPQQVADVFENYCASCHDEASSTGDG